MCRVEKNRAGRATVSAREWGCPFYRGWSEKGSNKVISEQSPEGREGASHAASAKVLR